MTKYLIEKPSQVMDVLDEIKKQPALEGVNLAERLEKLIYEARERVLCHEEINWEDWFMATGLVSYLLVEELEHFNPIEFSAFLVHKHQLYGIGPLLSWKQLGILMRLNSKVDRFTNLTQSELGLCYGDESVNDTLKDCLGYCVLGILLCRMLNTEEG